MYPEKELECELDHPRVYENPRKRSQRALQQVRNYSVQQETLNEKAQNR
jgi:hypothetical protein